MQSRRDHKQGAESRAFYLLKSPEATQALGRAMAPWLIAGDQLWLSGELGAGKTCLVQGLAQGLGISSRVQSPSFTKLMAHEAGTQGLALEHFDAYRMEGPADFEAHGFYEHPSPGAVMLIEWPERVQEALDPPSLVLSLEHVEKAPTERRLRLARGSVSQQRFQALLEGLRAWEEEACT